MFEKINEFEESNIRSKYPSIFSINKPSKIIKNKEILLLHDPPDALAAMLNGTIYKSYQNSQLTQELNINTLLNSLLLLNKPIVIIFSDVAGLDDMNYAINTSFPISIREK